MISTVINSVTRLVGGAQEAAGERVGAEIEADRGATRSKSKGDQKSAEGENQPNAWDHPGRRESDKALKRTMRVPEESINEFLSLVGLRTYCR